MPSEFLRLCCYSNVCCSLQSKKRSKNSPEICLNGEGAQMLEHFNISKIPQRDGVSHTSEETGFGQNEIFQLFARPATTRLDAVIFAPLMPGCPPNSSPDIIYIIYTPAYAEINSTCCNTDRLTVAPGRPISQIVGDTLFCPQRRT